MKKRKKIKELDVKIIKNPVAKFAFQFNKAQVFKDKTKYQRNAKHKGQEPFPIMLASIIGKGSCLGRWKQIIIQYCWSFYPSLAVSKQLRSLLCAC